MISIPSGVFIVVRREPLIFFDFGVNMSSKTRKIWIAAFGAIPEGYEIDHIDQDNTNDDLSNLRLATHAENCRDRKKWKKANGSDTTSKHKGVYWCKRRNKWISQIRYNNKTYYIGQFDTEYEAHVSWVERTETLYGEFFKKE